MGFADEFNCSYESLTLAEALTVLRNLPRTNPDLYREIPATLETLLLSSADVEELAFLETVDDATDC